MSEARDRIAQARAVRDAALSVLRWCAATGAGVVVDDYDAATRRARLTIAVGSEPAPAWVRTTSYRSTVRLAIAGAIAWARVRWPHAPATPDGDAVRAWVYLELAALPPDLRELHTERAAVRAETFAPHRADVVALFDVLEAAAERLTRPTRDAPPRAA